MHIGSAQSRGVSNLTAILIALSVLSLTTLGLVYTSGILNSEPNNHILSILPPDGSGSSNPEAGLYPQQNGVTVEVTAQPETGWTFSHWKYDESGKRGSNPLTVTMDSDHSLRAVFTKSTPPNYQLVIEAPEGNGTINYIPDTYVFNQTTSVQIVASAVDGWTLDHWVLDGTPAGNTNPISIKVDSEHRIQPVFSMKIKQDRTTLLVLAPDGVGSTNPDVGEYRYNNLTILNPSATPGGGWTLDHWRLDGIIFYELNAVAVDRNHTLQAIFTELPLDRTPTTYLTIQNPSGSGITDPIAGSYTQESGETASVSANPSTGWQFSHWTLDGDDAGSTNPISIAMDSDHTLQAVFVQTTPGILSIAVYTDSACTVTLSSVTLGPLHPGDITTKTIYVRNDGDTPTTLSCTFTDWNPPEAEAFFDASWDLEGVIIQSDEVKVGTITLEVSANIEGINTYSFKLEINGVA